MRKAEEIQDVTAAWYADLFHVRLYLDPYLKGEFPAELLHQLELHDCMFTYTEEDLQHIRAHRIAMLGIDYYFPIRVQSRSHPYSGPFHPKLVLRSHGSRRIANSMRTAAGRFTNRLSMILECA